jgi:hypothetical protein
MALTVVTLHPGGDLEAACAGAPDDTVVCVVPPGAFVVSEDALLASYDALGADVVLAAACEGPAPAVDAPTPYRHVAPACIGRAAGLRALKVLDAAELAGAYSAGVNLELDVGAEIFLVRDGTGTDAMRIGSDIVATATATRPAVVIGGAGDLGGASQDVARLFAYDAAPVHADAAREVAPDIVQTHFWTPAMCTAVVRAAEAAGAWGSDAEDPVPGHEVSIATLSPVLFAHVENHLELEILPRWRECWPELAWNGLHDAFVIKYAARSDADELRLHHDVAQVSGSVRLNTGYRGGALEFPRQRWNNHDVHIGELVAWPSLVTHPHRATPVTHGVKYGLTIWLSLPH